ncbi:FAD-dependent oxidoreductase [Chitinispirillales bacterium ANBcel5]|uniref:FAD-dependent oxidoreductase n=1 Tax=Cellulosispirillum alkaliphilum TaxID=3039283 RepID=UPI002A5607A0|nr:FAD-dependent oxidoreductase [Chitinispirillales bacterium ANBcel5]
MLNRYYYPLIKGRKPEDVQSDVCVYGATSSGIVCAVEAARMGKSVSIVEFGKFIGGMTTSGLSATDIGDKSSIGGLTLEFHKELGNYYGDGERWFFEPKVASKVFSDWIEKYSIGLYRQQVLYKVEMSADRRISTLITEDGSRFRAKVFVDATYEGDLMARAGVSYTIGREGNEEYDEHFSGIHYGSDHHNFLRFVDPYRVPGDHNSGLLPGISSMPFGHNGEGDKLTQAYNFRLCITKDEKKKVLFPKPKEYDVERYELLRRYIDAGIFDVFNLSIPIPNNKADHNSWGAVNSDNVGGNYLWPDGNYEVRELIYQDHIHYQKGLFWFLCNDLRIPRRVRKAANEWGLAGDEFTETDNWPPQLYVREARRMRSDYIITEHNAFGKIKADDPIGMASFKMDSHNCKRVVKSGRAMNEGNFEVGLISPYGISYRALRPKRSECRNLLVSICISASHIAYCSIRMESVYMIMGQSAGVAAAMAIDKTDSIVQDISYSDLQRELLIKGQVLGELEQTPEELELEGKRTAGGEVATGIRSTSR